MPGELFVEFGLHIKKLSPFKHTLVIELANGGAPGYIYPHEALSDGGYETDTSMLAPETGEMFVNISLEIICELSTRMKQNIT
jgi:hypothetical protein